MIALRHLRVVANGPAYSTMHSVRIPLNALETEARQRFVAGLKLNPTRLLRQDRKVLRLDPAKSRNLSL
jgi:hypothetical protein